MDVKQLADDCHDLISLWGCSTRERLAQEAARLSGEVIEIWKETRHDELKLLALCLTNVASCASKPGRKSISGSDPFLGNTYAKLHAAVEKVSGLSLSHTSPAAVGKTNKGRPIDTGTKRTVGRKVKMKDVPDSTWEKVIKDRETFQQKYRELGYKRDSWQNFMEWAIDKRDYYPNENVKVIKGGLRAFKKRTRQVK